MKKFRYLFATLPAPEGDTFLNRVVSEGYEIVSCTLGQKMFPASPGQMHMVDVVNFVGRVPMDKEKTSIELEAEKVSSARIVSLNGDKAIRQHS